MLIQFEILFDDKLSEDLGLEPKLIWGKARIDITKVISYYEWIPEGRKTPYTTLLMVSGDIFVVQNSYEFIDSLIFSLHETLSR
jgi:uncharacterized protein YlzI (FlbEa/FlbD family)